MITNTQLQNLLNNNNSHDLSGSLANEKIMRILQAVTTVLSERTSVDPTPAPSGGGLDEATMVHTTASIEELLPGENFIPILESGLPQSVPVGTYIAIGSAYLLGGDDSPISIDPSILVAEPATADDQPINGSLVIPLQIQTQVAVTGPFLSVGVPSSPFILDQVMTKWRVILAGAPPSSGTLKIALDVLFIPITPA